MELEVLKQAWSEYDKKLSDNLETNKKLLKEMNLDRAKSEMDTPRKYELVSLIIGVVFLLFVLSSTVRYAGDTELFMSGILTSIWSLIMTWLTAYKLKSLTDLDFCNDGLFKLQNKIVTVSSRSLLSKRFELYSFPIFTVVAAPILAQSLRGVYILDYPEMYFIGVGVALLLGYPLVIWTYRHWYKKKIQNVDNFLLELSEFESEQ